MAEQPLLLVVLVATCASAAPPTHHVGINIPLPTYWDRLHWLVDLVPCADFRALSDWSSAPLDSSTEPEPEMA
eukprot:m51a1_g8477 hypothetical protein (73) ;mRNA; f:507577-507795